MDPFDLIRYVGAIVGLIGMILIAGILWDLKGKSVIHIPRYRRPIITRRSLWHNCNWRALIVGTFAFIGFCFTMGVVAWLMQ